MTASWGQNNWGFPTAPCSWMKQPWILLSYCYMEAGLLVSLETDLRGNSKGTSSLEHADNWELPSSGCNWPFTHLALPGSLLAWEQEFLSPKSSLIACSLTLSHTPQGSVCHLLDEGDWTSSRTLVPDWSSVPISGQMAPRCVLLRMLKLPLLGQGL